MNIKLKCVVNPSRALLVEDSILRGEASLGGSGQIVVKTGKHTGRAAKCKHVVNNLSDLSLGGSAGSEMSQNEFDELFAGVNAFCHAYTMYVVDFSAGGKWCRLIAEKAWHALFVTNLFPAYNPPSGKKPDLTIVDVPSFSTVEHETFIACDYKAGCVLIAGTAYAGEIKKSVFSYLACVLPDDGILPMHSSVSTLLDSNVPTVFFGLSGTGKTTLSAGCGTRLLGDDEHGWSDTGLFNFEGGCYAKAIDLAKAREPQIWKASNEPFIVLENVVLDDNRQPIFTDRTLTENTRSAYPLRLIDDSYPLDTTLGHPRNVIMLTCDANGVLPGVSRLTPQQALYHFISGYTAKVAGTELGLTEPQTTFSACYGAPFMTRRLETYVTMLHDRLTKHGCAVWLVNTGWIGGPPGIGHRSSLDKTRQVIREIQTGRMISRNMLTNSVTEMDVPEGSYNDSPRTSWTSPEAYDAAARKLTNEFVSNFDKLKSTLGSYSTLAGCCFNALRG